MIISGTLCSNCQKIVPDQCDGIVYHIEEWKRLLCRGTDGDGFETDADGFLRFRLVRGFGESWLVPLIACG